MERSMAPTDAPVTAPLRTPLTVPVEPARSEGEAEFRELMVHLQQVFWMEDAADNAVLYVSPAYERIWGRTCQSLYDNYRTLLESVHPDDRERAARTMGRRRETQGYDQEFRILRPDGETRWIQARCYPVREQQGEDIRFAGISEDIPSASQPRKGGRARPG